MKYAPFVIVCLIVLLQIPQVTNGESYQTETQISTGGSQFLLQIEISATNMTRGEEYQITVSISLISLGNGITYFVEDLHDISLKVKINDTNSKSRFSKSSPSSGVVNSNIRKFSYSWNFKPDNSYNDISLLYISSEFREDIALISDPVTKSDWILVTELSLSGLYDKPQTTPWLTYLLISAGIIGTIIIFLFYVNKREDKYDDVLPSSFWNSFRSINFEKIVNILIILTLIITPLTILLTGFNPSNNESDIYAYHFGIETPQNWQRGEIYSIYTYFYVDNFGDYDDFHDITMSIEFRNGSSGLIASISDNDGRIESSRFKVFNPRHIRFEWKVNPNNMLPDRIDIFLSASFRLDKSFGADPRIYSSKIFSGTINIDGDYESFSSVLTFEKRSLNILAYVVGFDIFSFFILIVIRENFVKKKDRRF